MVDTDFVARYVTQTDLLDAYERLTGEIGALVAGIEPKDLERATPCPDWTVTALLNHTALTLDQYAALTDGGPVPSAEPPYPDPVEAWHLTVGRYRNALEAPDYLTELIPTPIGEQPGAVVAQNILNELIAHGWDLAVALDQPTDLAPDVATASLASWQVFVETYGRGDGTLGPEQPEPAGGTAADRLAAYLGRQTY